MSDSATIAEVTDDSVTPNVDGQDADTAEPVFKTPGLPLSSRGRGGQGQFGGQPGRGGSQHTHVRGGSRGRGGFPTNAGRPARAGAGSLPGQGSSAPTTPGSTRRSDQSNSGVTPSAKKLSAWPIHRPVSQAVSVGTKSYAP